MKNGYQVFLCSINVPELGLITSSQYPGDEVFNPIN